MTEKRVLYLVVPCYNEEEVLDETAKQLNQKLEGLISSGKVSGDSRILFVNDGSKDQTWMIISRLHEEYRLVSGLNLSRNRGHQNAVLAGLMYAKEHADVAISLDADLQDDVNAIDEMVEKYYAGNADYRLMSKRVLDQLENYKEVHLFLRGMVPLIGYPSDTVYYERNERFAGESKYPLKKMLAFAFDGISSFSVKPIRFIVWLGFLVFFVSLVMLIYSIVRHAMGHTVLGWSSLIVSIWALGGLQLLSIGVIGEYIGKVYMETKARPKFAIQDILDD